MKVSVRKTGSALSHAPNNWHAVDWRRVEWNVRGMQIRIAKATREGNWRRVKALQRMLTARCPQSCMRCDVLRRTRVRERLESIASYGTRLKADGLLSAG